MASPHKNKSKLLRKTHKKYIANSNNPATSCRALEFGRSLKPCHLKIYLPKKKKKTNFIETGNFSKFNDEHIWLDNKTIKTRISKLCEKRASYSRNIKREELRSSIKEKMINWLIPKEKLFTEPNNCSNKRFRVIKNKKRNTERPKSSNLYIKYPNSPISFTLKKSIEICKDLKKRKKSDFSLIKDNSQIKNKPSVFLMRCESFKRNSKNKNILKHDFKTNRKQTWLSKRREAQLDNLNGMSRLRTQNKFASKNQVNDLEKKQQEFFKMIKYRPQSQSTRNLEKNFDGLEFCIEVMKSKNNLNIKRQTLVDELKIAKKDIKYSIPEKRNPKRNKNAHKHNFLRKKQKKKQSIIKRKDSPIYIKQDIIKNPSSFSNWKTEEPIYLEELSRIC